MKNKCLVVIFFVFAVVLPTVLYGTASYPIEKMIRQHGVYHSCVHLDSRLPKVQISDFQLVDICEHLIGSGYNYFTITKHNGKYQEYTDDDGRSSYALDQFGLKIIAIIKKDKKGVWVPCPTRC